MFCEANINDDSFCGHASCRCGYIRLQSYLLKMTIGKTLMLRHTVQSCSRFTTTPTTQSPIFQQIIRIFSLPTIIIR